MSDSINYEDLGINEAFDLIRKWRENNERKFSEWVLVWEKIYKNLDSRPNEKYIVAEQLLVAMLDQHSYNLALMWLELLLEQFPGSLRVMRYKALCLEAQGQYDAAQYVLDEIIKVDETNAPARKRRVASLKAQGLLSDAIKELVDYLKRFTADMEAWQQLGELYLEAADYSRALFCTEELLLHQPHNHLLHQRLADIRYTMGGVENMELAKAHYCRTLKLNPNNLRALLGLNLVTNNLLGHYKSSGGAKRKEVWKLSRWVHSELGRRQADAHSLTDLMLAISIAD
ncbi:ER membrane protein complex subunit 2-like [Pieris brassicae]|uniref:ER membrane protein complex subunit 2 n=1 Tax=Pieris brassicae TaxID=7116 RepID=A0A9P0SXK2_PIEBR|nr:ER membrane protein complex subunit 2-like [Pieris brassicae]CAH3936637.1 unnamed protein product [Pieris brassicae]